MIRRRLTAREARAYLAAIARQRRTSIHAVTETLRDHALRIPGQPYTLRRDVAYWLIPVKEALK